MPVKDFHEPYLLAAVESMLAQTHPAWRLLVVAEPASRAELEGVLDGALEDSRVAVAVNEGRRLAGAFNTGMRRAETGFVAILLGDDMWAPEAVEVLTRAIDTSPESDFFHSGRRIVDDDGRQIAVQGCRTVTSVEDFGTTSPVKHLLCWRREKGLEAGGMDESLDSVGVDDFDFPWTMAERGAAFTAVPEPLYVYRDHRASFRLTTHLPLSHHKRETARILRKHGMGEPEIRRRLAAAERDYLKQCLYRSRLDRWVKTRRGHDPRAGWREPYA
jgi:GT2 family glycosyltransferase